MKKFKCRVTKTYEYDIELDENIWTEINLKEWGEVFYPVTDLEDLASTLASMKTNYDEGDFIEGFGVPMINGKEPFTYGDDKDSINKSVNINIISENEIDVETEEV
jgi:hypothetical protein